MSSKYGNNIEGLVALFSQTHQAMQAQVARSVDTALVVRNWLFGWYIVEFENGNAERAELYGKKLIDTLSHKLKSKRIKGISPTNLRKFRDFYQSYSMIQQALPVESFPNDILEIDSSAHNLKSLVTKLQESFILGWTHYVTLLTIKNPEERRFYELEAAQNSWGYRELERQINTSLYERLALSRDKEKVKELAEKGQIVNTPSDVIKNPYILEFTGLEEQNSYSEHDLETAIINKLEVFLLELGKGFLFEARQKRFTFDNQHFYVDLVFYNRLLRSYVLIDLKVGDLKHQDLGQMQMYVNYFDRYVKLDDEKPTVGILLCHSKNDDLVELTLPKDSNIYASEYQLYLPDKETLKQLLIETEEQWKKYHKKI